MNKGVENQLIELLQSVNDIKDFTIEQAPDVVQQLLTYSLVSSLLYVVVNSIIIVLAYMSATKWSDQAPDLYGDWSMSKVLSYSLGSVAGAIALAGMFVNVVKICKITLAPKLFVLEYASKLL